MHSPLYPEQPAIWDSGVHQPAQQQLPPSAGGRSSMFLPEPTTSSFWPAQAQSPSHSGQWYWSAAQPPGFPQSAGWFIPVSHSPAALPSTQQPHPTTTTPPFAPSSPSLAPHASPTPSAPGGSAATPSGGNRDNMLLQVVLQTQQIVRLRSDLSATKAMLSATTFDEADTKRQEFSGPEAEESMSPNILPSKPQMPLSSLSSLSSSSASSTSSMLGSSVPGIEGVVTAPGMNYRIRRHIGEGAFGTRLGCTDYFGHVFVAQLVPAARARAANEQEWLQDTQELVQLHHPNIVQLCETFESHGVYWMIYEETSHYNLGTLLERKAMTELETILAARQILAALDYCHARQLVHGSLHADSVMVAYCSVSGTMLYDHRARPFVLKVGDVGMSGLIPGDAEGITLPAVSRAYDFPPELCLNGYVCQQSDLYQLGLLIYLMYVRQPALGPADGTPLQAVQSGVARSRAESIGTELGMLVSVLLRRTPAFRYQTTRDLWDALHQIHEKAGAPALAPGEVPPTKHPHLLFNTAAQLAVKFDDEPGELAN